MIEAKCIGPMQPWACTWTDYDGVKYGVTLYATDPEQIEADNPSVRVDGRLIAETE